MQKSQMARDVFVEESQRMRELYLPDALQPTAASDGVARRHAFAAPVERHHRRFGEGRRQECARFMGQVMIEEMPAVAHAFAMTEARLQVMRHAVQQLARRV